MSRRVAIPSTHRYAALSAEGSMNGKVLVTGGAGYIGSHTAQQLLDAGNDVVILDNLSNGDRAMAPDGARFVRGDLADRALLAEILGSGIDAVLHFAGSI